MPFDRGVLWQPRMALQVKFRAVVADDEIGLAVALDGGGLFACDAAARD
jgi:hypothetical protein